MSDVEDHYHISGELTVRIDTITDQEGAERTLRLVHELGILTGGALVTQTLGPGDEEIVKPPETIDPEDLRAYLIQGKIYKTPAAATSQASRLLHSFSGMCESIIRRNQGKQLAFPMEIVESSAGRLPSFATLAHFVDYVAGLNKLQRPSFFVRLRSTGIGERSYEVLKGYVESKRKTTPVQE